MKVLVYPHDLAMGGSQLNAIDIAHELQARGHDVILYGQPGPLVERIRDAGLEFVASPDPVRRPSRRVVADLARLVRERQIDVLHGYEWPPGLECYLAARVSGAVAVTTVMSMAVAPFLPRDMHVVVGTELIAATERRAGRRLVSVIEPPVDTANNNPEQVGDVAQFRSRWLPDERPTLVCVTRLVPQLKLEGILTAIDAVTRVNRSRPLRMLIVGDGPSRDVVEEHARRANAETGPGTVVLTGEVEDPRPAYASATICLGMGGSALRALAFERPLVVQGEDGFFRLLTEDTVGEFLWAGWYGRGGPSDAAGLLADELVDLLDDPERRAALGVFGRNLVDRRFSLEAAGERQEAVLRAVLARPDGRSADRAVALTSSVARFGRYHVVKRARRLRGVRITDDFNGQPAADVPRPTSEGAAWLWFPGVWWDGVAGTDRQLVNELATQRPVVWVDPPISWLAKRRRGIDVAPISRVGNGVIRVSTTTLPGVTRPVLRELARRRMLRNARTALATSGLGLEAVVVATPEQVLPSRSASWLGDATRLYYETDDFVAGASLLGHSTAWLRERRRVNVDRSDVVLGVTDRIVDELLDAATSSGPLPDSLVLPNGCHPDRFVVEGGHELICLPAPVGVVVGQLNERLELDMLDAVAATGASLLLVGPRHEQTMSTRARIDDLLTRANVQWIDRQPFELVPHLLAGAAVGLTPYTDTDFNRASFPLKTMEYLAAGLPVVSTDLPSARSLASPDVVCATTALDFASATSAMLALPASPADVDRRRSFAAQHSWSARAEKLIERREQRGNEAKASAAGRENLELRTVEPPTAGREHQHHPTPAGSP